GGVHARTSPDPAFPLRGADRLQAGPVLPRAARLPPGGIPAALPSASSASRPSPHPRRGRRNGAPPRAAGRAPPPGAGSSASLARGDHADPPPGRGGPDGGKDLAG